MEKCTVLVLGATGNLGAYSALALKEAGFEVVAAGRRASDNGFFRQHGIRYYSVDITDLASFEKLDSESIDVVANFAGELPSRCSFNPQKLIQTITEATLNVLEFMVRRGIKKIIFPTTPYDLAYLHESGEPIGADEKRSFPPTGDHSVYAIAKNAAVDLIEHYHYQYGISRFILRFFTIYQYHPNAYHFADGEPRMMPYRFLIDRAQKGLPITVFGDPSRVKEMVYIKDFTKVVIAAAGSPLEGGFYNVGSPSRVSLDEMIHGIVEVFSDPAKPSEITYDAEKPDTLQSILDWEKTRKELHYEPEYDFLTMMKDFKIEMEEEPMAGLWGKASDYSLTRSSN
ncbi:NAD-dependent epimerase/dehydratase family protein [Parvibacter caecicola]|uniref:NAD(P)-dependent oxidoreductase n=1 Tax=Parvibacter caecicola TaxID=747645 RepID=A0A4T9T8H6_9ACTN|nr:NAD(P)-dependent oxidoreductase [Parvibacter caecicola]TJW11350.1 NAD(P)-dependent oxidoreductase [Parvibacter caecicola]